MATEFTTQVIRMIKAIPQGRVATYGQIAALAGKPHGARGVAWILNSSSKAHDLPWQRVLNSKGKISFPPLSRHFSRQKNLLLKEGVVFVDHDLVDMKRCQWKKTAPKRRDSSLRSE